jgi:hypothetical protein
MSTTLARLFIMLGDRAKSLSPEDMIRVSNIRKDDTKAPSALRNKVRCDMCWTPTQPGTWIGDAVGASRAWNEWHFGTGSAIPGPDGDMPACPMASSSSDSVEQAACEAVRNELRRTFVKRVCVALGLEE